MSLTPLDIRKMTFPVKMRGYVPTEVESFLELAAEALANSLAEAARLEQENRDYRRRLDEATQRQQELQETMLQAQKLSKEITENGRREATLLVKEAEITADTIVSQAIEQANHIEAKIRELRAMRRELQLKFRNTLELFQRILEAEMEEERTMAPVRTMPRRNKA